MRASKLNILILAAGLSTRLGQPKPLVRIQGEALLRRALLLSASLAPHAIFAVVPGRSASYRHQARGIKARLIPNPKRREGLASSVRLGVGQARFASALLILPADLYALSSRDLLRLIAGWRMRPGHSAAARIGTRGAVPLILPARLLPAAAQLRGDSGFRDVLARLAAPPTLIDMPAARLDIDTVQDLQEARRRPWRRARAGSGVLPKRKIAKHL